MTINPLFSTTKLNEDGVAKATYIRESFNALLSALEDTLPGNSRELSIVRTKLEEASFYAIKALRNYEGNKV